MLLFQLAASREKSDSKSKAIGFLKLLRSRGVIMMALFLKDILTVLQKVSLKFQEANSVVADVSLCIKTALIRIRALEKRYLIFHFTTFIVFYYCHFVKSFYIL